MDLLEMLGREEVEETDQQIEELVVVLEEEVVVVEVLGDQKKDLEVVDLGVEEQTLQWEMALEVEVEVEELVDITESVGKVMVVMEEMGETPMQEVLEPQVTMLEMQETQDRLEVQETQEILETQEIQEMMVEQEETAIQETQEQQIQILQENQEQMEIQEI